MIIYLRKIIIPVSFLFMHLSLAFTTDQPLAEPSTDLRGKLVMFSVEVLQGERTFALEKTVNGEYFLKQKNNKGMQLVKIAGKEAVKLDRAFSTHFLSCQFEIPEVSGDCKVTLRLNLRGESQDLCLKDEQKTRKIMSFLDAELIKRF
jgi:hypothetical protein